MKDLLRKEIEAEFEALDQLNFGSDEHKVAVDGLVKLVEKSIELEKIEDERSNKEKESELKLRQVKEDNKDRWIRNGITVAGIVVPSAITVWGTLKSLKFEETGSITTIMGRGFINKLLPKK